VDEPRDWDFEQASFKLNEGLKNCRTVLSSYRALLSSEAKGEEFISGDSGSHIKQSDDRSSEE
jgi:hypothetical protein